MTVDEFEMRIKRIALDAWERFRFGQVWFRWLRSDVFGLLFKDGIQ